MHDGSAIVIVTHLGGYDSIFQKSVSVLHQMRNRNRNRNNEVFATSCNSSKNDGRQSELINHSAAEWSVQTDINTDREIAFDC